jgi:hypothetical protein
MSERLFNPEEIQEEQNEKRELLPGELYDLEEIKEKVKVKTKPGDKEQYFGESIGHSIQELLTIGPEPFVAEYADHMAREKAREEAERRARIEHNGIIPEKDAKRLRSSFAYDTKNLVDAFIFFKKLDNRLTDRLETALEEAGIDPKKIFGRLRV